MTTLTLEKLAIAPLADLTDVLMLKQSDEAVTATVRGEVRTYAGGRRRVITRPGESRTVPFSFSRLTRDEYDALSDLVGVPVLVRDQRERAIAGVFFSVSAREAPRRSDRVYEVTFVLDEISWDEAV